MKTLLKKISLILLLALTACAPAPTESPLPTLGAQFDALPTSTPFRPVVATLPPTRIPTVTPQPLSTDVPLTGPYSQYAILSMRARSYGGGTIEIIETMGETNAFTRYKIRYPSDGLNIYGFMNIPHGEGPFPVIIAIHGYSNPDAYSLLSYTTGAADDFAREGYLVFHPNMRGYGESDNGDSLFRAGLAVDILNLIALVKTQALQPGLLEKADPERLGIWSHSMGGEIALRVITISNDVKATMLYAPMTGDVIKNAQILYNVSGLPGFLDEQQIPSYMLPAISPMYFYNNVTSAIKLYHGTADASIPVEYSRETCQQLTYLGKEIDCIFYEGAQHTFSSLYVAEFRQSFLSFFENTLKIP